MQALTEQLCERIIATTADDLTDEAIARARQLFMDGLAVAIAGTVHEEAPAVLAEHTREMGGNPMSTVFGFGFKTSPVQAAYVNGSSMHVLDFEPMWSPANHQLSTCLPAVLALAESRGADGMTVATALVKGIEIMGWIRQASGFFDATGNIFHPPGVAGPMGATVASAHLLGLNTEQLRNAVGITASRCGSLLPNAGTMTKSTHCGLACSLGLDAALLAAKGFTANREIFEVDRGYAAMYFNDNAQLELLLNYGAPFRVVEPGYALKMFPCQFGTHFCVTAGLQLHPQIVDPASIKRIHMRAPVMPYVNRPQPDTGLAGKFSMQYTLGIALLDGEVVIESFTDERRFRDDIVELLPKFTLEPRDDIPTTFEKMHIEAEVELTNGERISTRCDGPRGIWGGEPVPLEDHEAKLRNCFSARLNEADIETVLDYGRRLETLSADEVRALIEMLA
ncbi:MAG: 2-methylcitrate dehydratase PrpD [Gammaproteobacteria bacterium]|jgi:2-methylcitrate dehydratase PrpD